VVAACIVLLGVALTFGLRLFFAFEGKTNSLATFTEPHPRHREIEFAIFLASAFLPVVFYFAWRRLTRRKK
jgi:hypothetical protein